MIHNLLKYYQNEFIKNILKLFTGTALAQVVNLGATFILAKFFYSPEDYGELSVFISIATILSIFSTFRYELAIVLPKRKYYFIQLFYLSITFVSINTIIFFALSLILKNFFLTKFSIHLVFSLLLCLASFFLGINKIYYNFLTKIKIFKQIAISKLLLAIFAFFSQVAFYYSQIHNYGLILGYVFSLSITVSYLWFTSKGKINIRPSKKGMIKSSKKYFNIVKYGFPADLINSFASNVQPMLIIYLFSSTETGLYFFAIRLLQTPFQLISSSISQVYYSKVSDLFYSGKEKIFGLTVKIILSNLLIIGIPLLLLLIFSEWLIIFFFGEVWSKAGSYITIMIPFVLIKSLFSPISNLAEVYNKTNVLLFFNLYYLLANIISIYIGSLQNDFTISVILLTVTGFFGYGFLLCYFLILIKK